MKFREMTYTRPDIDALLARCKELAAKAESAASGEALVDDTGHLMEWKSFDTEAEAIAWLDACFTTEPTVVTEGG